MRTKFICIIWTLNKWHARYFCSLGLSLFVLFELNLKAIYIIARSWGLSLFVLFELPTGGAHAGECSWGLSLFVLFEPGKKKAAKANPFLRTKFICIIWTKPSTFPTVPSSWGLSLFVLFEPDENCSWAYRVLED